MYLVIDGNNLAHRVFHTPQGSLTKKDGTPSGVVLGVPNSIKGMLEKLPEVERVIVTWDAKGGSAWRKAIYPAYKGNRDYGKDDDEKREAYEGLFMQMEYLHEHLHLLGINSIKVEGYEADDLMAVLSKRIPEMTGKHVLIATSDKDMLQLVSKNVSVYSPFKEKIYSPANFFEEIKVTPEAYVGYRALVGDKSDNIQGIEGIAEGKAGKLMDEYGHIDNILNAQGPQKAKLMKSKVYSRIFTPEGLQTLAINNKIMNFKFVPASVTMEDLVEKNITTKPEVDSKAFRALCTEWQFASILCNYLPFISPFNALGEDD